MKSYKKLNRCVWLAALVLICGLSQATAQGHSEQLVSNSDQWVAADALGRSLPTYDEAGPIREGKYVGLFYWLWHASVRIPGGEAPPIVQDLIDENPDSPGFRSVDYYWSEPEMGFYHPSDRWAARRNLTMIANAGVDFIFIDYTNGPLGSASVEPFMEVALELYDQGLPVPKIVFFLNANFDWTIENLMNNFYNRPEYEPLWFYWHGKPLIMANPDDTDDPEILDFFTWRTTWAFRDNIWTFIDDYPQRVYYRDGQPEQIAVNKGMGAPLGDGYSKGSSFHNGEMPEYDEYWLPVDRMLSHYGLYFDEHWRRAHEVDPEIILITGWNEWTAAAWPTEVHSFMGKEWNDPSWRCVSPNTCIHRDADGNHIWPHGWLMVDQFNAEFNRDVAPIKGGHTDSYYYQMVDNIRRFKGMEAPEPHSDPRPVDLAAGFQQWQDVLPIHRDPRGDTAHRNFQSVNNHTVYTDATGRNDIIESRVTHDGDYVYFHVKTAEPLTHYSGDDWMLLFIDADRNNETGWEGYDYLINHRIQDEQTTTISRWQDGSWTIDSIVDYRAEGTDLHLKVPRELIHQNSDHVSFHFKWADNIQGVDDIENFFLYGDVAPDRRFNYLYDNAGLPHGGAISAIEDRSIPANTDTGPLAFSLNAARIDPGTTSLSGSSSNRRLVPDANIVIRGSGTDRSVTVTPAAGQTGTAIITLKAADGHTSGLTRFALTVVEGATTTVYNFDDGSLQGWEEVSTDNQGRMLFAIVPPGVNSPNTTPHSGGHFIGLHIPAFGGEPTYTQDSPHDTLVMRSPEFHLSADGEISAWLAGGGSGSSDLAGTAVDALPATSSTGGFMGIALRDVTGGTYVMSRSKTSGGNEWEEVVFSASQLASLPRDHVYTLDLIDARHGGWGWINMDTVTISSREYDDGPPYVPPTISLIANRTIDVNSGTGEITFTVGSERVAPEELSVSAASLNADLIPESAILFGGSGPDRTVAATPALNETGGAIIVITVSDGELSSETSFVVTVDEPEPIITFEFSDGTMDEWTAVKSDSQGRMLFAIVPPSVNSPNTTPHSGGHFIGLHIPAFGGEPTYTQDGAHDTLVIRSPAFTLNGAGDLSVWLLGGGTGSANLAGTSVDELPETSSTGGFMGVALRNATTGTYVLSRGKPSSGDNWQEVVFTAAELAGAEQDHVYTLDLIDARHGGWGWINMDTVTIPGFRAAEPVADPALLLTIERWGDNQVRLSWPADSGGWTLQRSSEAGGEYTDADLEVTVEGDENVVFDTIPTGRQFYRLRQTP